MTILDTIFESKRISLMETKEQASLEELQDRIQNSNYRKKSLVQALTAKETIAVIAEIKTASPSAGLINNHEDINNIAKQYVAGGAAAISVITEEHFFQGSVDRLQTIAPVVDVPILRKDFLFDPYQLYESKAYGADAILLIAAMLEPRQLIALAQLAKQLELEVLFEAHSGQDIKNILHCAPDIIGINARDLATMTIDASILERLVSKVPQELPIVAESGIASAADVTHVASLGARAVLVGTSLMQSSNHQQAVEGLTKISYEPATR